MKESLLHLRHAILIPVEIFPESGAVAEILASEIFRHHPPLLLRQEIGGYLPIVFDIFEDFVGIAHIKVDFPEIRKHRLSPSPEGIKLHIVFLLPYPENLPIRFEEKENKVEARSHGPA